MGRRQYLTRLALGRSAFQPGYEVHTATQSANQESTGEDGEVQSYDDKGNPLNPEMDAFNARMRKAQNEVLALVGVVERKDHDDQLNELRFNFIHKHRKTLLHEEHERGDLLEYVCIPIRFFCHLWPDAFRQRIQIGYYDASRTMAEILSTEWASMWVGGVGWSLATRFPAFGDTLAHICVRVPLLLLAEQATGRLQNAILQRKYTTRKARENVYTAINVLFEGLVLAIDIALLPMEYHACAQRLGLAPPLPLLPSWKTFLPWGPESFHNFGWKPLFSLGIFTTLTSPAALLLLHKVIHYDAEEYDTPIFSLLTDFRYPPINDGVINPKHHKDPFGRLMHYCYTLRNRFMQWAGWNMTPRDQNKKSQQTFENNMVDDPHPPKGSPRPIHRSTAMAQLPAQILADMIDRFFSRIIYLPFEALVVSTIARTKGFYPHAPITALINFPNATNLSRAGQYLSRLGLSLALTSALDTILFFGLYRSVRSMGIAHFDWGRKGRIGKLIYTKEGMNGLQEEGGGVQIDDFLSRG